MKVSVLIVLLVAVLASGAVASTSSTTAGQSRSVLYGHVKSVSHTSRGYQLKLDPAWDPLRKHPRFAKLLADADAKSATQSSAKP